jgi:hypothetical protein
MQHTFASHGRDCSFLGIGVMALFYILLLVVHGMSWSNALQ